MTNRRPMPARCYRRGHTGAGFHGDAGRDGADHGLAGPAAHAISTEVRQLEAATAQRPPAALTALVEQLEPGFRIQPNLARTVLSPVRWLPADRSRAGKVAALLPVGGSPPSSVNSVGHPAYRS